VLGHFVGAVVGDVDDPDTELATLGKTLREAVRALVTTRVLDVRRAMAPL
jgi:hypothetical protein